MRFRAELGVPVKLHPLDLSHERLVSLSREGEVEGLLAVLHDNVTGLDVGDAVDALLPDL